jgi:beta-lactamase regulating signal transducer with metallopeptidase domain
MLACQNILTALGWCLLDSIWQMALMWLIYKLVTTGSNRISPAAKHNLILLFSFIGTEWFVYSVISSAIEPSNRFVPGFLKVSIATNNWTLWLSVAYLIVLSVRLFQYSYQYFRFKETKESKSPHPVFQAFADRYSKILGIHRKVKVSICTLAETAETSRFFKPVILLPLTLISQLSPQQIEAILVHELYHIRRNDYLINICMSCFRSIFFFNPFAHLFYKELARERELACDDGVLELGFTPDLYAETLFSLEKFRTPSHGFSLAADGNRPWLLMERIRRVLGKPELRQIRFSPLIIFSGLIAVGLIILRPSVKLSDIQPRYVIQHKASVPVRYESLQFNISGKQELTVKIDRKQKHEKAAKKPDTQSPQVAEPDETPDPPDMTYYADNKISRDFSNQATAELSQDHVQVLPGSPYVPSVSLAYDAQPVIIAADSMRDIQIKNEIRTIVCLANVKAIANLKELEMQMDKSKQELTRIKIENQKLLMIDQRNLKPLMRKIQKQIESKKIQVEELRNKLQISEAEIIHI